jgi:predicted glycosyltransferase
MTFGVTLGHRSCPPDVKKLLRLAFYSYDEQGLGHVRRSIAIAHALSDSRPASIMLVAGAREASLFRLPEGTDTLALPAPATDFNGTRRVPSLGLDMAGTVRLRARALRSALTAFEPDVLVVDRLPLGVYDELADSLGVLRAMGTRLVLGLREVLDDPAYVRAEWDRAGALATLRRYYHAIWVYGDPDVYDLAVAYDLPADVRGKVRYSGYLDRHARERSRPGDGADRRRELGLPDGRLALCLLGGGEDGHRLAEAFARARRPAGTTGVIVAGPFMPEARREQLAEIAGGRDDLRVLGFVPDAELFIPLADDVVAMGGYNTTCEILATGARALIVPRAQPSREQLVRAQALAARGAVDVLHPDRLSSDALSEWLTADAAARARPEPAPIDLDGLERLPALLDEVLAPAVHRAASAHTRFGGRARNGASLAGSASA